MKRSKAANPSLSLPSSLREFITQAWHVVEPAEAYVPGWHLDVISDHLEAVTRGEIRDLVINIPPRHMKSLACSVFWQTWVWTMIPSSRWLFASYAEKLAVRDSAKARRLMLSDWYQERWGHLWQFVYDSNQKMRYENTKSGLRIAAGAGGAITGDGGDFVVADDPNNVTTAESTDIREGINTWWDETMSTRGNDPKTSRRVIIQQRTHESDLTGHVLSQERGYHHLCLPARYEPRVQISANMAAVSPQPHDECRIGTDPRTDRGELLWPERYGEPELLRLEQDLGTYAAAGQLQMRPVPREGAMFSARFFKPLPVGFKRKDLRAIVQYWDLAFSEKESADYTAGVTLGIDDDANTYILDVYRDRPGADGVAWAIAERIILQEPSVVGLEIGAYEQPAVKVVLAEVSRILSTYNVACAVKGVPVTKDKVFRAQLPATRGQNGFVYADRNAPWWQEFEAEHLKFPRGAHDDLVDANAGAHQLALELAKLDAPTRSSYVYGKRKASEQSFFRGAVHGR